MHLYEKLMRQGTQFSTALPNLCKANQGRGSGRERRAREETLDAHALSLAKADIRKCTIIL